MLWQHLCVCHHMSSFLLWKEPFVTVTLWAEPTVVINPFVVCVWPNEPQNSQLILESAFCPCREGARPLRSGNQPLGSSYAGLPHDQRKAHTGGGCGGCVPAQKHPPKCWISEPAPWAGLIPIHVVEHIMPKRGQFHSWHYLCRWNRPGGSIWVASGTRILSELKHHVIQLGLMGFCLA